MKSISFRTNNTVAKFQALKAFDRECILDASSVGHVRDSEHLSSIATTKLIQLSLIELTIDDTPIELTLSSTEDLELDAAFTMSLPRIIDAETYHNVVRMAFKALAHLPPRLEVVGSGRSH